MDEAAQVLPAVDIDEILRHIPHRYPFLLIDRVEACAPNQWVRAIKNVTGGEWFANGDAVPQVMPQLLVVEALAQAAGALCHYSGLLGKAGTTLIFLAGIDDLEATSDAMQGDTLTLECTLVRAMRGVAKLKGRASVGDRHVLSATLLAGLRDAG